jgi:acyl carrier protein
LARRRADGELEYLGRADTQVKLRGFRIELSEIESALLGHAEIRQAAVVVQQDGGGDTRLVAYVVPAAGATLEVSVLRAQLKARLPDYMVPQAFVVLNQLPLTPNGKLDRRALPAPDTSTAAGYVAPRNAVEATLARIFADVLGRERIGINDNFFELGGDSIRATRAITRLQQEFRLGIPLRALFESPRTAELADRIETLRWVTTALAISAVAEHDTSLEQGVL